jgi:hypothetical protein
MLSSDGDHPMTTTDFSKKQLATILSALDDAPRSPANKGEALRAIGRSAQRFGLTTDDVLAAAPGLLDGRLSPADFRVELHDLAGPDQSADSGQQGPTVAQGDAEAGDIRRPSRPSPYRRPRSPRRPSRLPSPQLRPPQPPSARPRRSRPSPRRLHRPRSRRRAPALSRRT